MSAAGSSDPVAASLLTLFILAKYLRSCWVPILRLYRLPDFHAGFRAKKRPTLKCRERCLSLNQDVVLLAQRAVCVHSMKQKKHIKDAFRNYHLSSFSALACPFVLEHCSVEEKGKKLTFN